MLQMDKIKYFVVYFLKDTCTESFETNDFVGFADKLLLLYFDTKSDIKSEFVIILKIPVKSYVSYFFCRFL
jgi:hypothetical protein